MDPKLGFRESDTSNQPSPGAGHPKRLACFIIQDIITGLHKIYLVAPRTDQIRPDHCTGAESADHPMW